MAKDITIDESSLDSKDEKDQDYVTQEESFKFLEKILFEEIDNVQKNKKSKIHTKRTHNAIFVNGKRGSGKTQFLLSIQNYIKKHSESKKKVKKLYFFNPIDPTLLHDNENFLTFILAQVLNELERKGKLKNLSIEKSKKFYQLLNNLSKAIDGTINNNETRTSLENIAQDQSSLKLEIYMDKFFYKVTKMLNTNKVIILIDDIDMALNKGFEVLEVIRKYLSSPYIIPIITGNIDLYELIVKDYFYSSTNKEIVDREKIINQTSKDYLIKILPMNRRIEIKSLWDLALERQIIFDFHGKKYYLKRDILKGLSALNKEKDNLYFNIYNLYSKRISERILKNLFTISLRSIIQIIKRESSEQKLFETKEDMLKIKDKYGYDIFQNLNRTFEELIEDGDEYYNLGDIHNDENKYLQALEEYLEAIKLNENEKIIEKIGDTYLKLFELYLIASQNNKKDKFNNLRNQLFSFLETITDNKKKKNIEKAYKVFEILLKLFELNINEQNEYLDKEYQAWKENYKPYKYNWKFNYSVLLTDINTRDLTENYLHYLENFEKELNRLLRRI